MKNSVNKVLVAAVVILLLANIAMVIMMIKGRNKAEPRHQARTSPFEMMVKEVGMSEKQQKDYEQMKDEHMKTMRPLFDSLRAAKTAFFSLSKSADLSDSMMMVSHKKVDDIQMAVDKMTVQHFRSVRALFDTAQQRKFDEFVQKMMQRGGPGGRKKDSTEKDK